MPSTRSTPPSSQTAASTRTEEGLVEEQQLVGVRRFEGRRPLLEMSPGHRRIGPLAGRGAKPCPLDELLQGRVEVVQLDGHSERPRAESLLVPFGSSPVPPFEDHALTPSEQLLGQRPELGFEPDPELVVPHVVTQL